MGHVARDGITVHYDDRTRTRRFWEAIYPTWELDESRWMQRFCRPDRAALDIGAWNGAHAFYMAHLSEHVYAIEPDPWAFADLQANRAVNPRDNMTLLNVAVADRDGTAQLGARGRPLGYSAASILPAMSAGSDVQVRTVSFATLLAATRLAPRDIAFIKIDIEGAEAIVVPTLAEFLAAFRGAMCVSLHPHLLSAEQECCVRDTLNAHLQALEPGLWAHQSVANL